MFRGTFSAIRPQSKTLGDKIVHFFENYYYIYLINHTNPKFTDYACFEV